MITIGIILSSSSTSSSRIIHHHHHHHHHHMRCFMMFPFGRVVLQPPFRCANRSELIDSILSATPLLPRALSQHLRNLRENILWPRAIYLCDGLSNVHQHGKPKHHCKHTFFLKSFPGVKLWATFFVDWKSPNCEDKPKPLTTNVASSTI